jgi:hypothetical protein
MRWRKYAIGALVVVVAAAGTAWALRKQVILYLVATVARNASKVEPHREIVWARGPETARRRSASVRRTSSSSWPTTSGSTTSASSAAESPAAAFQRRRSIRSRARV